jgi:uncharacterized hydrophobic protein (TIGR00341 family)
MPDRLIEILVPDGDPSRVEEVLRDGEPSWIWRQADADGTQFKVHLPAESVERVLDALQLPLEDVEGRAFVVPVEATLPGAVETESAAGTEAREEATRRISRQELYADLVEYSNTSGAFVVTTALAVVVAAIGMTRDSPAITIGAMVIAPLLGPNMALSLATTLADRSMGTRALKANLVGVATTLAVAAVAGLVWKVDLTASEIASRTTVSSGEILLALATGVAGAIAVTRGLATSLVGVMVAVALLPPLVIGAMLLVQGHPAQASNAALLAATNVICVNLAGVATFYVQGIRPSTWWEAEDSRRATRAALVIWIGLLGLVAVLIAVAGS